MRLDIVKYLRDQQKGFAVTDPRGIRLGEAADEIESLRECLSEIEDFARGEGDVGNIIARKVAAKLRPETAPPDQP
jgi:hypothetical protein